MAEYTKVMDLVAKAPDTLKIKCLMEVVVPAIYSLQQFAHVV